MYRILWVVFFINILVIALNIFDRLLDLGVTKSLTVKLFILFVPIILLFLHSMYSLGRIRGLLSIAFASLVGLVAMLPTVIVNLLLFNAWSNKVKN